MLPVRHALEQVMAAVSRLGTERVGLFDAVGRVLAEDVHSARDVPGYANSAMDGFAVRHADLARLPARLHVTGTSAAGAGALPEVKSGQALKIMTGAPVPPGADTVVRVEDTRRDGEFVLVEAAATPGSHVRLAGEDVRTGTTVLESGRRLTPADVGLAASVGKTLMLVRRRPRVAIVSTGNELVEADEAPATGQIVNSNAYALAAAVTEAGGIALPLAIARDTPQQVRDALHEAARADAILSTGGVSVGDFDYVKTVMDEIGVRRLFWKVAQKPGKPLVFGLLEGRPVFGLPGNPVSSLVCFYLYARPALRRMMDLRTLHLPTVVATLAHDLKKAEGLTEFVRCRLERKDGRVEASSTGTQSSAVLSSLSQCDGLIIGPPEASTLQAGSAVRVIRLDPDAACEEPPV